MTKSNKSWPIPEQLHNEVKASCSKGADLQNQLNELNAKRQRIVEKWLLRGLRCGIV